MNHLERELNNINQVPRQLLLTGEEPIYQLVSMEQIVERNKWPGLSASLRRLFPELEKTPIPQLVGQALDTIMPFCDPLKSDNGQFLLRGSLVKRLVLGTPQDYFKVKELFQKLQQPYWEKHLGHRTGLVNSVVERISAGPDVDVMYRKKPGVTDLDIIAKLKEFVVLQNLRLMQSGWEIEINQALSSKWNGKSDPRIYTQLTFYQNTRFERKARLRFDVGEIPDDYLFTLDGRLSGLMTSRDILSTAPLQKRKNGQWYIFLEHEAKELLKYNPDEIFYQSAPAYIKLINTGRMIFHRSLWPYVQIVKIGSDMYLNYERLPQFLQRQAGQRGVNGTIWQREAVYDDYFKDINISALNQLELRETDIVATIFLGACYAAWEWPILADALGVLKLTGLGEILTPDVISDFLKWGIETEFKPEYNKPFAGQRTPYDQARAAELLTKQYRRHLQNPHITPNDLWPLKLLNWLSGKGHIAKPPTLATFINLINPVVPLKMQRDEIGRRYAREVE